MARGSLQREARMVMIRPTTKQLKQSSTYGDLPKTVQNILEPHVWGNMNISEQRDWAIKALSGALILIEYWTNKAITKGPKC